MTVQHATRRYYEIRNELAQVYDSRLRLWTFDIDNAKRRIGCCIPSRLRISISRHYLSTLSDSEIEDTIRHEIAHALDFMERGTSDHGWQWQRWAIRCGARPERCKWVPEDRKPVAKWTFRCDNCGYSYSQYRLTRRSRNVACGHCCKKHNRGMYDPRFKFTVIQNY